MHMIGPSSAALMENVTQESVDQASIGWTLLYRENEEKGGQRDPFSPPKGAVAALPYNGSCNIHLENAVSCKNEPRVLYPPGPTPCSALGGFLGTLHHLWQKIYSQNKFLFSFGAIYLSMQFPLFWNGDGCKFQQRWSSLLPCSPVDPSSFHPRGWTAPGDAESSSIFRARYRLTWFKLEKRLLSCAILPVAYFLKGFPSFIEGISIILFYYSNSFVFQNPRGFYDVELLRTASLSLSMWLSATWLYRAEIYIYMDIALTSACIPCLTAKSHTDNQVQSTPRPGPSSDYYNLFWFSSTTSTAPSRNCVCVISSHKILFLIPSSSPGWKCPEQSEHLQDLCVTFHPGVVGTTTTFPLWDLP